MLSCRLVRAFAEVKEKAALSQQSLMKFFDVGGFNVRYFSDCFRQVGLVRLFDIPHNASVIPARAGVAEQLNSLTGGYTSKHALTLDTAYDSRQQVRRVAEHLHGAADQLAVFRRARPGVAVSVLLRHIPEPKPVVAQMIMEFDQARKDRASGWHHLNIFKSARRRGALRYNRRYGSCFDIHRGVIENSRCCV